MRGKFSYANVMSSLGVFLAMGGGAVYAAERIGSSSIAERAITSGKLDRNAVTANKISPEAVRRGKLARGAVARSRIAAGAVGSEQIADGSVTPADLEFATQIVASPSGGPRDIPGGGPTPYPLASNTWTQEAGELDVIFGSLYATLAYDGGGAGSCSVNVSVVQDGVQVGGGFLQTTSSSPAAVTGSVGAAPGADPETPSERSVSLELYADGCTTDSRLDRAKLRVLSFGG